MNCFPSEKEFLKLARRGNLIPVSKEIAGDLDTPVSAYFKLAQKAKYSFLLESVEGEEKVSRFSFLARDPEMVFTLKGNTLKTTRLKNGKSRTTTEGLNASPLSYIRKILRQYRFVETSGLPRFCGGVVGYFGYDVIRYFERLPQKTKDDLRLPDAVLLLVKDIVIFDHRNHKLKVVSCVHLGPKDSDAQKRRAYQKAVKSIERVIEELKRPLRLGKNIGRRKDSKSLKLKVSSNLTKDRFKKMVFEAKKLIRSGEIVQVVLSQRFAVELKTDPFEVYRVLRGINPSPYMYYLQLNGLQLIGSSPELLVRCEHGQVETRPIAGTRRRGRNEKEDAFLAEDLLNDAKEKAEHIMLVDLGRNDLGRVSEKGTVKVNEFMTVEKYSHVMHMVSNVQGRLKSGKDDLDVLQAAFPAGTVSGAPKIRAMEIIEDLEPLRRGPYAGCIGYFSFSGNLDSCITIRTIVATKGKAYVQAGAGIVADSQPEREFHETVNKAKAQILAIEKANNN